MSPLRSQPPRVFARDGLRVAEVLDAGAAPPAGREQISPDDAGRALVAVLVEDLHLEPGRGLAEGADRALADRLDTPAPPSIAP